MTTMTTFSEIFWPLSAGYPRGPFFFLFTKPAENVQALISRRRRRRRLQTDFATLFFFFTCPRKRLLLLFCRIVSWTGTPRKPTPGYYYGLGVYGFCRLKQYHIPAVFRKICFRNNKKKKKMFPISCKYRCIVDNLCPRTTVVDRQYVTGRSVPSRRYAATVSENRIRVYVFNVFEKTRLPRIFSS